MRRASFILVGIVAGAVLASTVPAVASWLVSSEGEANVVLASLAPLKVGKATVVEGDLAFPGKTVRLAADVENPNPISLTLLGSDLKTIKAENCDVSGVKYLDNNKVDVASGMNQAVVLGRVVLPDRLANSCQAANVEAVLVVRAAYGVED